MCHRNSTTLKHRKTVLVCMSCIECSWRVQKCSIRISLFTNQASFTDKTHLCFNFICWVTISVDEGDTLLLLYFWRGVSAFTSILSVLLASLMCVMSKKNSSTYTGKWFNISYVCFLSSSEYEIILTQFYVFQILQQKTPPFSKQM